MYSTRPGLILGFHGCDQSLVQKVFNGKKELNPSNEEWDWLAGGIYFWENSYERALEFATTKKNKKIRTPAVIGAVLNLGYCLDLLDFANLPLLKAGYSILKETYSLQGLAMPENKIAGPDKDLLIRKLDCKVIETLHRVKEANKEKPFDSVRAVFWEGAELYDNAGFKEKNHIQICIRNPNCIKGYFLPRKLNALHDKV